MLTLAHKNGGLVMADTYKIIDCPACGKPMKKVFLPEAGINIDICLDGCGGIFFDNREFKKFDEQHENLDEVIQSAESSTFPIQPDEDAVRVCPACGANMVKNSTSDKNEIIIDECYSCGAKFLDHGELTKIRAEYATEKERADAAVRALLYSPEGAELARLNNSSERVQRKLDRRNASLLGKLFNRLMGI